MSFIHEKLSRRFFVCIILLVILAFLLGIGFSLVISNNAQGLIINKERKVCASLIESGVESSVIADAMLNNSTSQAGDSILKKIGIDRTSFLTQDFTHDAILSVSIRIIFCSLVLILITVIFLERREKIYKQAEKTITSYNDGDFSKHLPSNLDGTVYRLFADIENLAKALSAKTESEKKTKEFLKDMISDISHQIKTPIAALTMYNDIIAEEPENAEVVKSFTEKSRHSIERIENLVKTILKLARLDTQNVTFHKEDVAVCDLVSKSIEELSTRAKVEDKKIEICGSEDVFINCDPAWLAQAIANLVKNALDYTKSGGKVKLSWVQSPVMTKITIADNGRGIYPDDLHNIFTRFYRSRHSTDAQGAGLGLPLAKSIIEGQEGVITVDSKVGEGTTFTVSFLTDKKL